tara:strand:+ start:62 stop:454 length:393 start_codon:yes stop_codon:yes gene_type:complete
MTKQIEIDIMLRVNKLRGLACSGASTGNYFDDINIFKDEVKKLTIELEDLINKSNELNVFTVYNNTDDGADWDEYNGFTVIAKTEYEAMRIAYTNCNSYNKEEWIDQKITKCELIEMDKAKLISSDFKAG